MNRLVILVCIVVAALGAVSLVEAQNVGALGGRVVDQNDQPIEGAQIQLSLPENSRQTHEGESKKNGEFMILTGQTSGPWKLVIRKEGYTDHAPPEPFKIPLGGSPLDLGVIKLWQKGAAGAPVSKEDAERLERAFQALKTTFNQAVTLVEQGEAALAAGDEATYNQKLDEADTIYRGLLEKTPDIAAIHYNHGIVLKKKKQWEASAAAYLKATELEPEMIEAFAGAAEAYQKANQVARGEEMLAKAVADHPAAGKLHYLRGVFLFHNGKYPDATAALKKAQELDPANPEPLYYLGTIAVSEGRTNECIALLEKYLASNPTRKDNIETAKGLIQALKPAKK